MRHPRLAAASIALGIILAAAISTAFAGSHHHGPCCPQCGHKYCVAVPEKITEKKHCWNVECKDVCIPRFKWPWECCCTPPKCSRARTVKVLKKHEYECEKCGCRWEVHCSSGCGCDCGRGH
ncbi:MAG: hypothetical protein AB7O62_21175 [Pirellulales bacterium]